MTLIAAFRAREGGVLLCADREENDGFSKREVEKISRLSLLQCQMFIAGAGYAPIIKRLRWRAKRQFPTLPRKERTFGPNTTIYWSGHWKRHMNGMSKVRMMNRAVDRNSSGIGTASSHPLSKPFGNAGARKPIRSRQR
jgi:hypothetical protein